MLLQTMLVAASPFDERLSAARVASAIGRGLHDGGRTGDLCALDHEETSPGERPGFRALLDALDFDLRMRAARAVIVATPRLHERTLAGSVAFEIATRARQAGVPAYAITGENRLDAFDARIIDVQAILEAHTARALRAAGRELAELA